MKRLLLSLILTPNLVWAQVPGVSDSELQQCAVDLCGPAQKYATISANGAFKNLYPKASKEFIQQVRPKLENIFDAHLKRSQLLDQALNNLMSKNSAEFYNYAHPDQIALFNMIMTSALIEPIFDKIVESRDGVTWSINSQKLLERYPHLGEKTAANMAELLNSFLMGEVYLMVNRLADTPFDLLVQQQMLSMGGEIDGSAEARILAIENLLVSATFAFEKLESRVGEAYFEDVDTQILYRRGKSSLELTDAQKSRVIHALMRISNTLYFFEDSYTLALKLKFDFSKIKSLLNFKNSSQPLSNEEKISALKSCEETINRKLSTAPSQLMIRSAENLAEKVRAVSKTVAKKNFSAAAYSKIEEDINKVTFFPSPNLAQIKTRISDHIEHHISKAEQRFYSAQALLKKGGYEWVILASQNISAHSSEAKPAEAFQRFCSEFEPETFVDAAYYNIDKITVGWQSTLFPGIGKGIIAHEFGHIVQNALFKTRADENESFYKKAVQWSVNVYTRIIKKFGYSFSPTQFVDEDWADQFAIQVVKALEPNPSQSSNFACVMNSISSDEKKYSGLQLVLASGLDTHSTSLWRAILVGDALASHGKKEFPKSCESIMDRTLAP